MMTDSTRAALAAYCRVFSAVDADLSRLLRADPHYARLSTAMAALRAAMDEPVTYPSRAAAVAAKLAEMDGDR